jgi:cytochrome P450
MSATPESTVLPFREGIRGRNKETYFRQLHDDAAPVRQDPDGFWIVTGFDAVRETLLDHRRFSSNSMGGFLPLISDDPPRHSTLRGLLSKAFTPSAIDAMRPWVTGLAERMAGAIGKGAEVDAVAALTSPLPIAVIARMMGIPNEDNQNFRRWSNAIVGVQDGPIDAVRMQVMMELRAYFLAQAKQRRIAPGDDLITALVRADESGVMLSDEEIVGFCILLLIAGNETTTNLLGNLLNRLAQGEGDWARMKRDPSLLDNAIEEALRLDSPAQFVFRTVREDAELAGHRLKAGDRVIVYLAAANRDPDKFADPAGFDLARAIQRHVAFGQGVHTCIGAPLSRLEAQCAMRALVSRFDGVRPGAAPAKRIRSGLLFGFESLPLVFA